MIDKFFNIANNFFKTKGFNKALNYYKKCISEKDPLECRHEEDARVIHNMALCYIEKKEYEKAIGYIKKAIKLENVSAKYYYNLGYCYHMLDKRESLIYFTRAWVLNPKDKKCKEVIDFILDKKLSRKTLFIAIHKEEVGFEVLKYMLPKDSSSTSKVEETLVKSIDCKGRNSLKYYTLAEKIKQTYHVEKIILL